MNEELKFSALDRQFGDFLQRLAGGFATEVRLVAMCASLARTQGHVCIPLGQIAGATTARTAASLRKKLRASSVVGEPGDFTPLILDQEDRLYLRRYWEYEQQLAAAILQRTGEGQPSSLGKKSDPQEAAATRAVTNKFAVITGGPGTGKTWTVMKILARLLAQPDGASLRIALAAPTGKAAARLTDAVRAVRQNLEATTIHRLLGYLPGSPSFRYDAKHPLGADVVIVDEASMVDLALMAKLVAAVRPDARLILLGDRDQLASVEAGSVLADVCAAAESAAPGEPLHGVVVELRQNYRFAESGGIFRVSNAVNAGDADAAIVALQDETDLETQWRPLPPATKLGGALREKVIAAFRPVLETDDPLEALNGLQRFRILCALRHGPFGVESLNDVVEQTLAAAGLVATQHAFYRGRPLTVTQNDYNLGLFNGDSGIILRDPEGDGELRAFFLSADGRLRRFLPSRLPQHETAFAMTVHKSQGSEFSEILLLLPGSDSPLLTRELLYTALTRAREKVEVWATERVLRKAIARRVTRVSGLQDALQMKAFGSPQSGSNR